MCIWIFVGVYVCVYGVGGRVYVWRMGVCLYGFECGVYRESMCVYVCFCYVVMCCGFLCGVWDRS